LIASKRANPCGNDACLTNQQDLYHVPTCTFEGKSHLHNLFIQFWKS
jgi:hypothetical protein